MSDPRLEADYDVMSGVAASMPDIVAEWVAASRTAVAVAPSRHTVAYGNAPGLAYDVFFPTGRLRGALIFLHGGFWVQGNKDAVAFPAPCFTKAGIAYISVTYGLAPAHSLDAIIANVEAAAASIAAEALGWGLALDRIAVVGHSAGAYLAAALTASPRRPFDPLATQLISGLFDLTAIAELGKIKALALSADDCRRLSISGAALAGANNVVLAVGSTEPAGFQAQTRSFYAAAKAAGSSVSLLTTPGDDHFSIARALGDPNGMLTRRSLAFFD
ncbi:alpha/beta hydrolase [Sphingoaurantiacus capsulatus]|uniref:Alpha/beta hydrolase n=1 Tax=Sphingoaurantiacus capsulatus TaxID=1771310 RepID=A0ABV7XD32_9SPHN